MTKDELTVIFSREIGMKDEEAKEVIEDLLRALPSTMRELVEYSKEKFLIEQNQNNYAFRLALIYEFSASGLPDDDDDDEELDSEEWTFYEN